MTHKTKLQIYIKKTQLKFTENMHVASFQFVNPSVMNDDSLLELLKNLPSLSACIQTWQNAALDRCCSVTMETADTSLL